MNGESVFLIPIVAMLIPIVAIIAGAFATASHRRAKADIQMAMIARGVPLAEIEAFQQRTSSAPKALGRIGDCLLYTSDAADE